MRHKNQIGFTLIEVLTVVTVFILFLGIVSVNILNIEPRTSLNINTSTIIADVKKQQLRAMSGDSYDNLPTSYGVFLEENKYTLFAGSTYQEGLPGNSAIALPDNLSLTGITFSGSIIVFNQISGEINNFIEGSNTFKVRNSLTNLEKTVTFNKLGVVTGVE